MPNLFILPDVVWPAAANVIECKNGPQRQAMLIISEQQSCRPIFNETLLNVKTWSFVAPLGLFPSAKPPRMKEPGPSSKSKSNQIP